MNRSYTILYVDDDLDDLLIIAEAFEKYTSHLKVIHAQNGFEALQTLEQMGQIGSLPCLIILDINMPVMDGKEALKRIRMHETFKDIPVVLFSTSAASGDRRFAESFSADFITKPLRFTDMESLVKDFVDRCNLEIRSRA